MLRPGFEPESLPREGKMIGRTTLTEHDEDADGWSIRARYGLDGVRTRDLPVKSRMLYQLSYEPISTGNNPSI